MRDETAYATGLFTRQRSLRHDYLKAKTMVNQIADGAAIAGGSKDHLIVFFSSRGAYRKGVFDSTDFSKDMPNLRLYLRDEGQDLFYLNGIPGLTANTEENAEFLKYFIERHQAERVTFVGMSLGAFGALTLGHLVGVDDIHLISSVNYLNVNIGKDPENGALWEGVFDNVNTLCEEREFDKKLLDSRTFIDENPGKVKLVRAHVVASEPVDMNHADHIRGYSHVQTHVHPRGRHSTLAALMLRSGQLMHDLTAPLDVLMESEVAA